VSDTRPGGFGRRRREEDGKLKRVGGLARDKPIFLSIETLRHRSKLASARGD
jgi:hypothetical protein